MILSDFTNKYPQHNLLLDARFWRALTFFAERNYEHTLEALTILESQVKGGRLEPEVVYRIAATQYAKGDYDEALVSIKNYLKTTLFTCVLMKGVFFLGDIQMGRGNLELARSIFGNILRARVIYLLILFFKSVK